MNHHSTLSSSMKALGEAIEAVKGGKPEVYAPKFDHQARQEIGMAARANGGDIKWLDERTFVPDVPVHRMRQFLDAVLVSIHQMQERMIGVDPASMERRAREAYDKKVDAREEDREERSYTERTEAMKLRMEREAEEDFEFFKSTLLSHLEMAALNLQGAIDMIKGED